MRPLRFVTAGSVDDGKSTLMGRLLLDTHSIPRDQLKANQNLAELVDGLREEREAGITIDVAYRYFSTEKRRFVIADSPGHFEYVRNMVTATTHADALILLVDVELGLREQTVRHAWIARWLGVQNILVCVNKMDRVAYSRAKYEERVREVQSKLASIISPELQIMPISALTGECVVRGSDQLSWYTGPSVLQWLEGVNAVSSLAQSPARFRVQFGLNDQFQRAKSEAKHLFGDWVGGTFQPGTPMSLDGFRAFSTDGEEQFSENRTAGRIELSSALQTETPNWVYEKARPMHESDQWQVEICWLSDKAVDARNRGTIRHGSQTVGVSDFCVERSFDFETFHWQDSVDQKIGMNQVVSGVLKLDQRILADLFRGNPLTSGFAWVDPVSGDTVAVGKFSGAVKS